MFTFPNLCFDLLSHVLPHLKIAQYSYSMFFHLFNFLVSPIYNFVCSLTKFLSKQFKTRSKYQLCTISIKDIKQSRTFDLNHFKFACVDGARIQPRSIDIIKCDFLSSYDNSKGGTHFISCWFLNCSNRALNTIVFELLDYEMHKKEIKTY